MPQRSFRRSPLAAADVDAAERAVRRADLHRLLWLLAGDDFPAEPLSMGWSHEQWLEPDPFDGACPCPICQAPGEPARILSAPPVEVVGTGWYCRRSRCRARGTIWSLRAKVLEDPDLVEALWWHYAR